MTGKRVLIAELTAPHGVRGLLRLRSFAEPAEDVFTLGDLHDDAGAVVKITRRASATGVFIVAVEGVADRTQADAWRGTKLYIDRAALPRTGAREFYAADLEGLEARDSTGKAVGTIARVLDYGAGPVLEIKRAAGPPLLLPFNDAFVPAVDIETGIVTLNMPVEE